MWKNLFGLYQPISAVFDGDSDGKGNANNANVTGGDDKSKAGGGGSDDSKKDTYELTVDGTKRTVTLDEMKDLAQKSAGADKKFQDASEMKKSAESGLRIMQLTEALSDNPTDAQVREFAALMNLDPDEFIQYLKEDDGSDNKPQKGKTTTKLSAEDLKSALKEQGIDLDQLKAVADYSHQRHIEDARKEIRKISDEAVDKDEIFGKIKIGEKGKDRLAVVQDLVAEDVLRKIQDGVPFGADMVKASVQKIRSYVTKFGIPGKPDEYPISMGLGPGAGFPASVNSEEPIKRVSAAEDGNEENFIARATQKALKMLRNKGTNS